MTNVLYVIGNNPMSNNNAILKYSLRALDMYAHNLGNLYVIGYPPSWLSDKVYKLSVQDTSFGKHWNILKCIVNGVKHFGIKGNFLYSSDDHILLRDCDLDNWPRYEKGMLYNTDEYVGKHRKPPGKYQRAIVATRQLYDMEMLPPVMSNCHMNTWMNADYADEVMELAKKHKAITEYGFEPTCLFTAVSMKHDEILHFEHLQKDVKFKNISDFDNAVTLKLPAFSVHQSGDVRSDVNGWLKKKFGEKSQWEK